MSGSKHGCFHGYTFGLTPNGSAVWVMHGCHGLFGGPRTTAATVGDGGEDADSAIECPPGGWGTPKEAAAADAKRMVAECPFDHAQPVQRRAREVEYLRDPDGGGW